MDRRTDLTPIDHRIIRVKSLLEKFWTLVVGRWTESVGNSELLRDGTMRFGIRYAIEAQIKNSDINLFRELLDQLLLNGEVLLSVSEGKLSLTVIFKISDTAAYDGAVENFENHFGERESLEKNGTGSITRTLYGMEKRSRLYSDAQSIPHPPQQFSAGRNLATY